MSGSRDKSDRDLIGDLKETLRQHFKAVQTFDVAAEMLLETTPHVYYPAIRTWVFGGVLFQQTIPHHTVAMLNEPMLVALDPKIRTQMHHDPMITLEPQVQQMPCLNLENTLCQSSELLPETIASRSLPNHPVELTQASGQWPVESPKVHTLKNIPAQQLKLSRKLSVSRVAIPRFAKPRAATTPRMKTRSQRVLQQRVFPIQLKPIPPHRFSPDLRNRFRQQLAKKANIPVSDVKLVSIYDRVYLSLYQSLKPEEDGSLLCLPKEPVQIRRVKEETMTPFYLIIGQSIQSPDTYLQVVLPMAELSHDRQNQPD